MTKQTCPQCSSSKVIYYLYGYPAQAPEMIEKELGYYRVELMGCTPPIGEESEIFNHECYDCKYKWWAEDTDEDDE